ncbi:MAG: alpha-amylase family glycosyl hydrolase, partial [Dorea sp.]
MAVIRKEEDMKKVQSFPLPLGVTIQKDKVNFSIAAAEDAVCSLLLYHKGEKEPCHIFDMEKSVGEVRTLALEGLDCHNYEYNYLIDGRIVIDSYVKKTVGNERWGQKKDIQNHDVRGCFYVDEYDWEEEKFSQIPYHKVIAYDLHVRGFTQDSSSDVVKKGTFEGVVEKIPYLKELGINQIHCMPVYEFEEAGEKCNYWGYGEGYYFSPKNAYSANGDGVRSLKDM